MAELTVAEYVARIMKEEGVKQYFGVHGGHIWALMAAVEAEGGIKMHHVRHEQSGVYAADGFGRASGTPGVCFGTAGPGIGNMLTALLHAYLCKSPIVAFAGQHTTLEDSWGPFQEAYADKMCEGFTKWTKRIVDPSMVSYFVQKAFRDAISYPPGPVVVEIPVNILGKTTDEKEQRGYLHACLIPHYIKIQKELGSIVAINDAKEDLKKRFLGYKITIFCDKKGNKHQTKILRHTEDLTKEEYSQFIDDICNWFIDYFNNPAPLPRVYDR